jgi:thiamine kinase-like enzyme
MGIIENVFKQATGQNVTSLTILENGFSNDSYRINGEYTLRLKKTSDAPFYSAAEEKKIIDAVVPYRLTPKLFYFDTATGNKLERFLEQDEYFPKGNMVNAHELSLMASCLKRLHSVTGNFKSFYARDRYSAYKTASKEDLDPEFEEKVASLLGTFYHTEPQVLCHNDLWSDNILYYKGMVVLIDFEFAGLNNPLFDLASVIGENEITEMPLIEEFLKDYYGRNYNEIQLHKVLLTVTMEHFLWYYWAKQRYLQTRHPAFLIIAESKKEGIAFMKSLYASRPDYWKVV